MSAPPHSPGQFRGPVSDHGAPVFWPPPWPRLGSGHRYCVAPFFAVSLSMPVWKCRHFALPAGPRPLLLPERCFAPATISPVGAIHSVFTFSLPSFQRVVFRCPGRLAQRCPRASFIFSIQIFHPLFQIIPTTLLPIRAVRFFPHGSLFFLFMKPTPLVGFYLSEKILVVTCATPLSKVPS